LDAPVRVASDGDGGSPSAGPAQGEQTAAGSEAATQVGSVEAEVPVSVLSNDESPPDTSGGDDRAEVVEEVLDPGMDVLDELLDRGIRSAAAATGSTTDGTVTAPVLDGAARFLEAGAAALRGGASGAAGSPSGDEAGEPAAGDPAESPGAGETGDSVLAGDDGEGSLPSAGTVVPAALIDVAGTLPLTGLPAWLLLAAGVWLLSAGLALLLLLSQSRTSGQARVSRR
jgi:hypothetical protein